MIAAATCYGFSGCLLGLIDHFSRYLYFSKRDGRVLRQKGASIPGGSRNGSPYAIDIGRSSDKWVCGA